MRLLDKINNNGGGIVHGLANFLLILSIKSFYMKQSFVILPLISVLFLTFASCKQNYCRFNGKIWATSYHIAYRGDSRFSDSIQSELLAIDGDLSLFNPLSEVSAVNDGTSDSIGQRFADVFEISHKVWQLSGGVYDPTIGPLAEIWGFGRSQGTSATDEAIAEALDAVGLGQCYIYGNKIVKKSPATRFDFSSVAKGYGIDRIADMFDRNGITDYMIEIGGEVSARGVNPSGRPWNIQIDSPEGGMAHKRLTVVALGPERMALASSGNYRNVRRDSLGHIYGHTLSPVTGRPAVSNVVAVTVKTRECGYADALATACMASANADSALAIISRAGADALIIYADADTLRTAYSAAWQ